MGLFSENSGRYCNTLELRAKNRPPIPMFYTMSTNFSVLDWKCCQNEDLEEGKTAQSVIILAVSSS